MTETIRVTATGRAPGYLPEFVARELGFFEKHDVSVETVVPHDWEDVLTGIESGEWDLALGGIWVPSMFLGRGRDYVVTGQLCHRAGFCMVAREPFSAQWAHEVEGRSVLVPGRGGASMNMFFEMYMHEQGADPGKSRVTHDLTTAMMAELYAGGGADLLMIEAVQARRLEHKGHHIVGDFLADGDDIPWSVYYGKPEVVEEKAEAIGRFNAALDEAMAYMNTHSASAYVPQVMQWYPSVTEEELTAQAERMRHAGMWTSTCFTEASYQRWQNGIVLSGLLEAPIPADELIAPSAIGW